MKPLRPLQVTAIKKPPVSLASHQRGVALLVVLLLVVMIVILAGSMMASKEMTIRKSWLLFEQDKLLKQIQVGEQMAVELIRTDSDLNEFDSLRDVWATQIEPYNTDEGYQIELFINDASARFNLNNLYHDGAVDEHALASFQRLLESLGLEPNLATVVLDWQDPDTLVYNDGGEEAIVYKTESQKKSNVANQPFISVEQLGNLPNVTTETITILRPYVTALPYWLPVNVNTADELVLTSIVGSENSTTIQSLLNDRISRPIDSDETLQALGLFANYLNESADTVVDNNDSNSEDGQEVTPEKNNSKNNIAKKNKDKQKKTKEKKEKEVTNLSQLLSYKSRAFEVLISASIEKKSIIDSEKTNKKTRYSTLFIAKGEVLVDDRSQINLSNNDLDNKPSVRAFSQRMWAFRPAFNNN